MLQFQFNKRQHNENNKPNGGTRMSKKPVLKKLTQDEEKNTKGGYPMFGPEAGELDICDTRCDMYCVEEKYENIHNNFNSMYNCNNVYVN